MPRPKARLASTRSGTRRAGNVWTASLLRACAELAEGEREDAVRTDPGADEDAACLGAHVLRHAALPCVEQEMRDVDHALGEQERVTVAEIDLPVTDARADPAAEEQRVHVRSLDARLVCGPGALAQEQIACERERGAAVALERDGRRGRDGGGEGVVGRGRQRVGPELRLDAAQLDREGGRRAGAREDGLDGLERAGSDLGERHDAVVDGDDRVGAAAVDAHGGRAPPPLDAELPGVVVEADDALAAGARGQLVQRSAKVAQDAADARRGRRGLSLAGAMGGGDERGDVGTADEDVEHLARSLPRDARLRRPRGSVVLAPVDPRGRGGTRLGSGPLRVQVRRRFSKLRIVSLRLRGSGEAAALGAGAACWKRILGSEGGLDVVFGGGWRRLDKAAVCW